MIGIHLMDFDLFEETQACWAFELRDRQLPRCGWIAVCNCT